MSRTIPWSVTLGQLIMSGLALVGLYWRTGFCIVIIWASSETDSNRWTGFVIVILHVKYTVKCCSSSVKVWWIDSTLSCNLQSDVQPDESSKTEGPQGKGWPYCSEYLYGTIKTQRFYFYHLLGNVLKHSLKKNMICDWVTFASTYKNGFPSCSEKSLRI